MKYILFFLLCWISNYLYGQSIDIDKSILLSSSANSSNIEGDKPLTKKKYSAFHYNPISIIYRASKKLSDAYIEPQFLSECKFETNCKSFNKQLTNNYGYIKGLFLSGDRIMRCDRITHATSSPYRLNTKGKMKDFIEEYDRK